MSQTLGPMPPGGGDPFPLQVHASGRYLVTQQAQPWRIQADAAWLISTELTPANVDTYLADRVARGFNSFYLMAMVVDAMSTNAPNNYNGDPPFSTAGDFSTAAGNAASIRYWEHIDLIVSKAAALDVAVMLTPCYLGYQANALYGWKTILDAQTSHEVCEAFGAFLGNRYKDSPNVLWFGLGDYVPTGDSADRYIHIIAGIKGASASQLWLAEAENPDDIPSIDASAFASYIDMNSFYGYGSAGLGGSYVTADEAWRVSPARPAWVQESTYENESNTGYPSAAWGTRREHYWSCLGGGIAGYGFGSNPAWFLGSFPGCLSSDGADYMEIAFDLFASVPWWDMLPSGTDSGFAGKVLVTAGGGTWGQMDWVSSCVTSDGNYLLAYIPTSGSTGARAITIDMSAMSGTTRARWYNPTTGAYTAIGSGYANTGTREFTSSADNGTGTNDWVLVLDRD